MTGYNLPPALRIKHVMRQMVSPALKRLQAIMIIGLSPQKLALTLCLGAAFGVIPLVWGTSLICLVLAYIFRLNHVALQSVNFMLYPVHLALLIPFFKMGSWLFPWGPPLPPHLLDTLIQNHEFPLHLFGWITLKSLAAWMVIVLPAASLAYGILITGVFKNKASRTTGD